MRYKVLRFTAFFFMTIFTYGMGDIAPLPPPPPPDPLLFPAGRQNLKVETYLSKNVFTVYMYLHLQF